MTIEFRTGTPTITEHMAHGRVSESGVFASAWHIDGESLPRITFNGRQWFAQDVVRLAVNQTPLVLWTPTGKEAWTPLDIDTLQAVLWKTPPAIEYRFGTPTRAAHEAHGQVPTNGGRFLSVWRTNSDPTPRVTFNGHHWYAAAGDADLSLAWHPTGEESWLPLDADTFDPMTWKTPPPGAVALVRLGTDVVEAWLCTGCGQITAVAKGNEGWAQRYAERCCAPVLCRWDDPPCARSVSSGRVYCTEHNAEHNVRQERKRFESAEKIDEKNYSGPVSWEGADAWSGEGYFGSLNDLREACDDKGVPYPVYVYACDIDVPMWDAERVIEDALSDHHEDARDYLSAGSEEKLQAFLDEWSKDFEIKTWNVDHSRVVILAVNEKTE